MFYVLCGLQTAAIVIMFVEFIYVFSHWSSKQHSYLLMAILFSIINTLGYTMLMFAYTMEGSLAGCRLSYLGKTYVGLVTFLFVANYCRVHIPKWAVGLATAFQTFTLLLVLTCQRHTLFYTKMEFVTTGLFPHIEYTHGIFYFLFVVLQAAYFLFSVIFSVRLYRRTHIAKIKSQAKWLIMLLIVGISGTALAMLGVAGGYDLTILSYCVATIVLFVIVMRYDLLKNVDQAKNYIIEQIPSGILMADEGGSIIYSNELARDILMGNGISAEGFVSPGILSGGNLFFADKVYKTEKKQLKPSKNEVVDIYLFHDVTDGYSFQEKLKEEVRRQTRNAEERRRQVEEMSLQIVETLASAIDAKDPYTKGHSSRVAEYAVILAGELGYQGKELENIRYAALLHDIGKISVPDSVLNKPSKLTNAEYDVIKSHTTVGADILEKIESMPGIEVVARFHHERYGGGGYPEGIAGEDIPEPARIVSIADSYDAMNSRRVYRDSLSGEKIREELVKGRGSQFDPRMLDVFLRLLDSGSLNAVEKPEAENEHAGGSANVMPDVTGNAEDGNGGERDSLTGLLLPRIGEAAVMEEMKKYPGALALINVDDLKTVNHTEGHLAGDRLIRTVGRILSSYEEQGVISRHGGDEFLFFIRNADRESAEAVMKNIIKDFEAESENADVTGQSSLSVGICVSSMADSYSNVYMKADKALYYVKVNGKNGIHVYDTGEAGREGKKDIDLEKLVQSLKEGGRYNQKLELVMITLDVERKLEIDEIEKAMDCMGKAIGKAIRSTDISARYSSVQYFIILTDAKPEEIRTITNRIFKSFYKLYHGRGVNVSFNAAGSGAAE